MFNLTAAIGRVFHSIQKNVLVSAGDLRERPSHQISLWNLFLMALIGGFLFADVSEAAVSVSLPTSLQADFIANTTGQWDATVKPGLFMGDSKITITGKKPPFVCPACPECPPPLSTGECPVDLAVAELREMAKENYVFAYAAGQWDDRDLDLDAIDRYSLNFASTTVTWQALKAVYDEIITRKYGLPPGP